MSNVDPNLVVLVLFVAAVGGVAGWAICQLTHKQHRPGQEADRIELPLPPAPIIVPEHVPPEWSVEHR